MTDQVQLPAAHEGWPESSDPGPHREVRGHPAVAWIVITILAALMAVEHNWPRTGESAGAGRKLIDAPTETTAKVIVGGAWIAPQYAEPLLWQAGTLKTGNAGQRIAYAILLAELEGPEKAGAHLEETRQYIERARSEQNQSAVLDDAFEVVEILHRQYASRARGENAPLSADESKLLVDRLGWLGELAPLTKGAQDTAARERLLNNVGRTPLVAVGVLIWYGIAGFAGFVGLIILLVLAIVGNAKHGFSSDSGRGGVYVESFAIWMTTFAVLRVIAGFFASSQTAIAMSLGAVVIAAAAALAWPVIRGVPWGAARQDLGLYLPKRWLAEIGFGFVAYCMALPFMAIGFGVTIALMAIQQKIWPDAPPPSHPAQEMLATANWVVIVQVMVLGVIVAPIVEEIMFRGALYRHLRESTRRWELALSVILSAVVSSFLFGLIHPQGIVLIPPLMGLAVGFCITREWRGSLLACIIAHGTTNFVTLTLNVLLNA